MAASDVDKAEALFEEALSWLRDSYGRFTFFVERDLVWTVQTELLKRICQQSLAFRVFNDYGILPGERRSLSVDLAIVGHGDEVLLAVEFKYEPSHARTDIPQSKFPVVSWAAAGVGRDVQRVRDFVRQGAARSAQSLFIDEGGSFRHRDPFPGARWVSWMSTVSVLRSGQRVE